MNNLFKKVQEGFTLVEITVAMGMLGVLTTVMLSLNKQQAELEKRTEVGAELTSMRYRLAEILETNKHAKKRWVG